MRNQILGILQWSSTRKSWIFCCENNSFVSTLSDGLGADQSVHQVANLYDEVANTDSTIKWADCSRSVEGVCVINSWDLKYHTPWMTPWEVGKDGEGTTYKSNFESAENSGVV